MSTGSEVEVTGPSCWLLLDGVCQVYQPNNDRVVFEASDLEWPQLGVIEDRLVLFCGDRVEVRDSVSGKLVRTVSVEPDWRWAGIADGHFWFQLTSRMGAERTQSAVGFRRDGDRGPTFELPPDSLLVEHHGGPLTAHRFGTFDSATISVLRLDGTVLFEFDEFNATDAGAQGRMVAAQGEAATVRSWTWGSGSGPVDLVSQASDVPGWVTSIAATPDGWVEVHSQAVAQRPVGAPSEKFQKVEVTAEVSDVARVADGNVVGRTSVENSALVLGADPTGSWHLVQGQPTGPSRSTDRRHLVRLDEHLEEVLRWRIAPGPLAWCCGGTASV